MFRRLNSLSSFWQSALPHMVVFALIFSPIFAAHGGEGGVDGSGGDPKSTLEEVNEALEGVTQKLVNAIFRARHMTSDYGREEFDNKYGDGTFNALQLFFSKQTSYPLPMTQLLNSKIIVIPQHDPCKSNDGQTLSSAHGTPENGRICISRNELQKHQQSSLEKVVLSMLAHELVHLYINGHSKKEESLAVMAEEFFEKEFDRIANQAKLHDLVSMLQDLASEMTDKSNTLINQALSPRGDKYDLCSSISAYLNKIQSLDSEIFKSSSHLNVPLSRTDGLHWGRIKEHYFSANRFCQERLIVPAQFLINEMALKTGQLDRYGVTSVIEMGIYFTNFIKESKDFSKVIEVLANPPERLVVLSEQTTKMETIEINGVLKIATAPVDLNSNAAQIYRVQPTDISSNPLVKISKNAQGDLEFFSKNGPSCILSNHRLKQLKQNGSHLFESIKKSSKKLLIVDCIALKTEFGARIGNYDYKIKFGELEVGFFTESNFEIPDHSEAPRSPIYANEDYSNVNEGWELDPYGNAWRNGHICGRVIRDVIDHNFLEIFEGQKLFNQSGTNFHSYSWNIAGGVEGVNFEPSDLDESNSNVAVLYQTIFLNTEIYGAPAAPVYPTVKYVVEVSDSCEFLKVISRKVIHEVPEVFDLAPWKDKIDRSNFRLPEKPIFDLWNPSTWN